MTSNILVRPDDTCAFDAEILAAEHFNLLTWTITGFLRRVSASVSPDVGAIAGEMKRAADGER